MDIVWQKCISHQDEQVWFGCVSGGFLVPLVQRFYSVPYK